MQADAQMTALLKDVKGHFGAVPDLWQLASTASEGDGLETGWQRGKCAKCGFVGCIYWSRTSGYLCEDCKPTEPSQGSPTSRSLRD